MERDGPPRGQFALEPFAHRRRGRRPQVELAQRGAQVEPRAPDHDRAPSGLEGRVDLRVRERHELADREGLGDGKPADEPVLEACTLGRGRRGGEGLEPRVDLKGVGGDRDGILPGLPQTIGERQGDGRLADPRRTEDRQHRGARSARAIEWRRAGR